MKRLFAESVQTKLSICVKDARNECRILKQCTKILLNNKNFL